MKSTMRRFFVLLLALAVLLIPEMSAKASESSSDIVLYETILQQLNEELGTQYVLAPSEGSSYQDMVNFYVSMTMDEFEGYIRAAYDAENNAIASEPLQTEKSSGGISLFSTVTKQKYYYDGTNYLYINANTTTVSGKTIYTGDIESAGYTTTKYPYYKADSYSSSFASNKGSVTCTFYCTKYLAENLISGTSYTIKCTFVAGLWQHKVM